MADQWYYEREFAALGPFSGQQLADLATAGSILPTDTVWKEGIEQGVLASKVRHLFPTVAAVAPEAVGSMSQTQAATIADTEQNVESNRSAETAKPVAVADAPTPPSEARYQPPAGRARAVAGKGVVIVSQDGKTVKYRMKCMTCGHDDSSWKTMNIPRGTVRVSFYCTKCRKQRQLEMHGQCS